MKELLLVGFGGFLGSILRFLISKLNHSWHFLSLPMGTLTVNVIGSLIIGLLIGMSVKGNLISADLKMFLMMGLCGGFTTFSTFSSENMLLLQNGQIATALLYMGLSVVLGLLAVWGGWYLVTLTPSH